MENTTAEKGTAEKPCCAPSCCEAKLRAAGFTDIEIDPTRIYTKDDTVEMASWCCGEDTEAALKALDGAVMSPFIRAKNS